MRESRTQRLPVGLGGGSHGPVGSIVCAPHAGSELDSLITLTRSGLPLTEESLLTRSIALP